MRQFVVTVLVTISLVCASAPSRAQAPAQPPEAPPAGWPAPLPGQPLRGPVVAPSPADDWVYPLALGFGAIAGVVTYNLVTTGIFFSAPAIGARVRFGDVAMSRVYAVTAAVVGGWVANWLYNGQDHQPAGPFTS